MQDTNQAGRIKKILIFEDDRDYRNLLKTYLAKRLQGVELVEYDPVSKGAPSDDYDWSTYDVLILDYYLCIYGLTGLDLLQKHRKKPGFPATIMITGAGDEEVAVRAMNFGIYEYLRKEELTKEVLVESVNNAFNKHQGAQVKQKEQEKTSNAFDKTRFYRELENPSGKNLDSNERALLLIDVDNMDALTNEYGFIVHDNLLRHLAKVSYEKLRLSYNELYLTRLTDSSVAVLIQDPGNRTDLGKSVTDLCEHFQQNSYMFGDKPVSCTVSIGILFIDQEGNSTALLIEAVNQALDVARETQGNSSHFVTLKEQQDKDRQQREDEQKQRVEEAKQREEERRKIEAERKQLEEEKRQLEEVEKKRAEQKLQKEAEERHKEEERRKLEEERQQLEAERKRLEAEKRQLEEEEKKRIEEQRQREIEEKRKEEERRKLEAERQRLEAERQKLEEEKRQKAKEKEEKLRLLEEEKKRKEEAERLRLAELEKQRKQEEEAKRKAEEQRKRWEEEQRRLAEKKEKLRQAEEERKRKEEELRRLEIERQRKEEEQRRLDEERKKKEELRRVEEEKRKKEELRQLEEERKRKEEQRRLEEEARRKEEQHQLEEERKHKEEEQKKQQLAKEEKQRLEREEKEKEQNKVVSDADILAFPLDVSVPPEAGISIDQLSRKAAGKPKQPGEVKEKPEPAKKPPEVKEEQKPKKATTASGDEVVVDESELDGHSLSLKKAFNENRAMQTFQPVAAMFEPETGSTSVLFKVDVQIIESNGSITTAEEIRVKNTSLSLQQFVDRWVLREIIGRIVNNNDLQSGKIFIITISEAWLTDITLFNWLKKLLTGLESIKPSKCIALELPAQMLNEHEKRATALIKALKKSYGFRVALGDIESVKDVSRLSGLLEFNLFTLNYKLVEELRNDAGEHGNLMETLKKQGARLVVDGIEDSTMLTNAISQGADYVMGSFIGGPESYIADTSNVESLDII